MSVNGEITVPAVDFADDRVGSEMLKSGQLVVASPDA
jgi:hypothetical protein